MPVDEETEEDHDEAEFDYWETMLDEYTDEEDYHTALSSEAQWAHGIMFYRSNGT